MKLLVTGASGFIGRHLMDLLRRQGVCAFTIGRTPVPDQPGDRHIGCDLLAGGNDCETALRRLGATHLLHLAWVTDPASYQVSPLNGAWLQATQSLVRAFADAGGRHMVVAGTCAEYDWSQGWCLEDVTPLNPSSPYGAAKDTARRWLQDYSAVHGLRLAWARIFFPFGRGQSAQRLLPALVSALQGQCPVFTVQALQRRDFVPVQDVARALSVMLQASAQGCYNISSAEPVAIGDLLRVLARLLDADPNPMLAMAATSAQQPMLVAGDNRRLQGLGWEQPAPLADTLAQMVAETGAAGPIRMAVASHGH
jgi:nucleoside-diphosphate-sugar epimerase